MENDVLAYLVEVFGSRAEVARAAGVRPSAVSNWAQRGVPAQQRLNLCDAARRAGKRIDLDRITGVLPAEAA